MELSGIPRYPLCWNSATVFFLHFSWLFFFFFYISNTAECMPGYARTGARLLESHTLALQERRFYADLIHTHVDSYAYSPHDLLRLHERPHTTWSSHG